MLPSISFWCKTSLATACMILLNGASTLAQPRISTFAGTGTPAYSGDGDQADKAGLNQPFGIVRGPDGALYICDTNNHAIRKITSPGIISTVAGNGERGYSGDGGPATLARLNEPYEVRFDRNGNLFFVERLNHIIRRVDRRTQIITTVAGTGTAGYSGDGGPAVKARFNQPHSIQFDRKGDLYVCDVLNNRLRRIDMKTGTISTFAGNGKGEKTINDGQISLVSLNGPRAIDFDRRGNLWLALREGNAIYRLDLRRGTIHHAAGTGAKGFTGNGGPAFMATLSGPKGLSVTPDGNIVIADTESHSIRMIDVARGTIELVAGTGARGDGKDRDPLKCELSRPHGVFVDRDGSIFIGDSEANRVRIIRR